MNSHLSERRTEDLVVELLRIQGWNPQRPPKGRVIRQNEYKAFLELDAIFKGKSKSGKGDAYPDFLIISDETKRPQMIIEAKANDKDIDIALSEACWYANACIEAGYPVIAVGIAGQEKQRIHLRVAKYQDGKWEYIQYEETPISWIPTPADLRSLIEQVAKINLAPIVPKPEILAEYAERMNRVLREANGETI